MNTTSQADYAEKLLEAMKIVSKAEVQSSVQFDQTIKCTIVSVEDADAGVYKVNNGSANFIAYGQDTNYSVDDMVLVTIPQGDYNQQKIILGKYITKNSKPYVYKNPFDYFVDVTGNVVRNNGKEFSILANDVNNDIICPEGPIAFWSCLGSSTEAPLTGYDTIGLKADFMSLLAGFHVVSGNYGLRVVVTYLNTGYNVETQTEVLSHYATAQDTSSDSLISAINEVYGNNRPDQASANINEEEEILLRQLYGQKAFYFDVADMYGNPYDFDTYYEQQVLFNLGNISQIVAIQVDFFQGWEENENHEVVGSFKDATGDLISYYDELFSAEVYVDNIFVKDVYLALGYDESQFDVDKLILYTKNTLSYSSTESIERNKKIIQARWIHKNDDGEITIIEDLSDIANARLFWYRYVLNYGYADVNSGVSWRYITSEPDEEDYYAVLDESGWTCEFNPHPLKTNEQIKAIITYDKDKIVYSDILVLSNELEVPNIPTVKQLKDFYLLPNDNLNGVYNFYGNDNKILSRTTADDGTELKDPVRPEKQVRKLIPMYSGSALTDIEYIRWSIPWNHTMLVPTSNTKDPLFTVQKDENTGNLRPVVNLTSLNRGNRKWLWEEDDYDDNYIFIYSEPADTENGTPCKTTTDVIDYEKIPNFDWAFYYEISDTFIKSYINNSVTCEIIKDRVISSYTFNCRFGYNSTNGSDYTLLLSFDRTLDDKMPDVAMRVYSDNSGATSRLKVHLDVMDQNGTVLDWNNDSIFKDVVVKWEWAVCTGRNNYQTIYQPIDHDNIPQYRKNFTTDINENNAIPVYYTIELGQNETYTTTFLLPRGDNLVGTYDGSLIDREHHTTTYAVKLYKQLPIAEPHIGFFTEGDSVVSYSKSGKGLSEIYLQSSSNLGMDELYVLQVTVEGLVPYDLVSYLPIPLYQTFDENYRPEYVGPDMVRYDSAGNTDYYKDPCRIVWSSLHSNEIITTSTVESPITSEDFDLFIPVDHQSGYDTYSDGMNYGNLTKPRMTNDNQIDTRFVPYILYPLSVYLKDNPPYGIQYTATINGQRKIYWTQPIFCYINQWPNGTVNKWDGTGLIINEQEGYIIGHSITAGKKEIDNTFTGVMLGDLGGSHTNLEDNLSKNTGVFGFHHSVSSYAFKDDGTGYIGKPGHGRLEFDGNKGQIKSSSWDEGDGAHGMLLDFDDGIIKMHRQGYYTVVDIADQNEFSDYLAALYTYKEYKLHPIEDMLDANKNYYLPTSFMNPSVAITEENYVPNKYYRRTILVTQYDIEGATTDPSRTINLSQNPNSIRLAGTTTTIRSNENRCNRMDMDHMSYTYTESTWRYDVNPLDSNELIYYLSKVEDYTYILLIERWSGIPATAAPPSGVTKIEDIVIPNPDEFTPAEEMEQSAAAGSWWLYSYVGGFEKCTNTDTFDLLETYYISDNDNSRYITMSLDEVVYPLSIGSQTNVAGRSFKIRWDGTAFITDGHFSGHIDAKSGTLGNLQITGQLVAGNYQPSSRQPGIYGAYIEGAQIYGAYIQADELFCYNGELGGWYVGNDGLWNKSYNRHSPGGIYLGSGSSGIQLYASAIKFFPEYNSSTSYGLFGYLQSSQGGTTEVDGVGIQYFGPSTKGVWKTTIRTVGGGVILTGSSTSGEEDKAETQNGHNLAWIALQQNISGQYSAAMTAQDHVTIRTSWNSGGGNDFDISGNYILLASSEIRCVAPSGFYWFYNTGSSAFKIIKDSSHSGLWELIVDSNVIPAENQHGIYARFA